MTAAIANHMGDLIHAAVVVIVVLCAAILVYAGELDKNTAGNVFLAAVGYAAGRAGSGLRTALTRQDDGPQA